MVRVGIDGAVGDLRPGRWCSLTDIQIGRQVYDTLFEYSPDLTISPALAISAECSSDGRRWHVALRPDVVFHDGRSLHAGDLADQFRRRQQYVLDLASRLDDVRADGTLGLIFKFREPFAPLLDRLTLPAGVVASDHRSAGSGCYRVEDVEGATVRLSSTPSWRRSRNETAVDAEFVLFQDVRDMWEAIVSGRIDVASKVPYFAMNAPDAAPHLRLANCSALGVSSILLNVSRAPFDSTDSRRAVRDSVAPEALVQDAKLDTSAAARGFIAPASPFYAPSVRTAAPSRSGWHGLRFELLVTEGYADLWLQSLTGQFAAERITADICMVGPGALLARLEDGDFEAALVGLPGSPDPDQMLTGMFHSRGRSNFSGLADRALDDVLDMARRTIAADERRPLYAQAERLLWDLAPAVFLRHGYSSIAHAPHVTGLVPHPDSYLRLQGMSMSPFM
jgi:peptide/nickel transport system substrate-binding protein